MRKIFILLSIILFSTLADAQFIKEKSLTVHIGNASSSIDLINVSTGFYAQGEFAFKVIPWLEFRSYLGYVFGNTNILLTGGKVRIRPFYMRHLVSWFSTYADLGIGASIGEFKTFGEFDSISTQKKGIVFDYPFSFGIELGNNNNVSIEYAFYPHPTVDQFTSAFSVGIKLPLNNLSYR